MVALSSPNSASKVAIGSSRPQSSFRRVDKMLHGPDLSRAQVAVTLDKRKVLTVAARSQKVECLVLYREPDCFSGSASCGYAPNLPFTTNYFREQYVATVRSPCKRSGKGVELLRRSQREDLSAGLPNSD